MLAFEHAALLARGRFEHTVHMKLAALALLFVVACGGGEADLAAGHPRVGTPAPAIDLPDTNGGRVTLDSYRGKYLVVHFGTSW